jgi:hypothetical protein
MPAYRVSQQSMCFPLRHGLSNCSVFSFVSYSCLFSRICAAYADVQLLDLIYLICSLNLMLCKGYPFTSLCFYILLLLCLGFFFLFSLYYLCFQVCLYTNWKFIVFRYCDYCFPFISFWIFCYWHCCDSVCVI